MSLVEGMQWYPRVSLSYHPNTIILIYFEVNPISTAVHARNGDLDDLAFFCG